MAEPVKTVKLYHPKTKAVVEDIPERSARIYEKYGWTRKVPKDRQEDDALNIAPHEPPAEAGGK